MISIIAAMSKNRVIGDKGEVPWHITEDYLSFNKLTKKHPVIMGRKTHESISVFKKQEGWDKDNKIVKHKLLPKRTNIIITSQKNYSVDGGIVVHSLEAAIHIAKESVGSEEIFIIGGGDIYKDSLDFADKIYLTEIEADVQGDTFFPEIDLSQWKLVSYKKRIVRVLNCKIVYNFELFSKVS